MKKPHVLNRSMFNQGGTSAYGRGITSNLVSDEQRQRYNSGGRVGFIGGGDWDIPKESMMYDFWGGSGLGQSPTLIPPGIASSRGALEDWKWPWTKETEYPEVDIVEGAPLYPPTSQSDILANRLEEMYGESDALAKSGVVDEGSDTLDIMEELRDIYKPTEEDIKARKTGRAFKAMGTLGKLAFTPWKTKEFGKVLGEEGEKWAKESEKDIEDKKTMKILAGQAVGKKVAAEEKGIQTRKTAQVARDAAENAANAKTDVGKTFWASMANKPWKDENIADTLRAASQGAIDFKEIDKKTWDMIVKDPGASHGSQIVWNGDIMVVDKNQPVEEWSVKAQIFAKI